MEKIEEEKKIKETILVTGGAGFIGSNIVEELIKRKKYNVKVIDNLSSGNIENIKPFLKEIEFIKGDICNLNLMKKICKNVDYILHQAASCSVPKSIKNPILSTKSNILGTLNILVAAKECNVKRVVCASSSSVYGNSVKLPKKENMKTMPLSPYGWTKLSVEYYCKLFHDIYGVETVCLRYFNVFGKRQNPNSEYSAVIPKFIKSILNDKNPIIYGDGLTSRDFTYIDNNVNANILAMKAKDVSGKIFNIASGERINLLDLIEKISKISKKKDIKPIFEDERIGDVKHSLADISLAENFLKYKVKIDFDKGLKKTVEYYKNDEMK